MLTHESLAEDPTLWAQVDAGELQFVFASPEVLVDSRSHFWKVTITQKSNNFQKYLVLVAVDECHLIWDWKGFRPHYKLIGSLHQTLDSVPWLLLSATLTPAVAAYVHEVCKLPEGTVQYAQTVRRRNINLIVTRITSRDFEQLLELIPTNPVYLNDIPKTLIYVDKIDDALDIAYTLRRKMPAILIDSAGPAQVQVGRMESVRTYFASTDEEAKDLTNEMVEDGRCRIAICTDAFGMGVDIRDVVRVIQWDVTEGLCLNSLIQRLGRAARDPSATAVGIIYVSPAILDPLPDQDEIDSYDFMEEGDKEPDGYDSSDELSDSDTEELNIIPINKGRDLRRFGIPIHQTNIDLVQDTVHRLYGDARELRHAERLARLAAKEKGTRARPIPMVSKIDPGVLWVIGTVGCRWRPALTLYEDAEALSEDHASYCCDGCAIANGFDMNTVMHGISLSISTHCDDMTSSDKRKQAHSTDLSAEQEEAEADVRFVSDRMPDGTPIFAYYPTRLKWLCLDRQDAVIGIIDQWRDAVLVSLGFPKSINSSVVLPDAALGYLVKHLPTIVTVHHLHSALQKAKVKLDSTCLKPYMIDLLFESIDDALRVNPWGMVKRIRV